MNTYVLIPFPLWFMEHARHHSRGGRSRSARFLDRRGFSTDPDLRSWNSETRRDAWARLGPFRTPIYPARVTNADLLRAAREANACMNCAVSLADRRRGAQFCGDACRKAFWRVVRDKRPRSPYRGGTVKIRKRTLKNWCPVCNSYQPDNHPQPCKPPAAKA